jgi:hypothetical protein
MPFSPKTDVGVLFRNRLKELAATAKANAEGVLGNGPVSWYRPSELNKSLATEEGNQQVHDVFSREQQEKWFDEVTKDRNDTGTYGDLALVALQGDMLACMERAYRARHQSACQTRVYPAARLRGHGMTLE